VAEQVRDKKPVLEFIFGIGDHY